MANLNRVNTYSIEYIEAAMKKVHKSVIEASKEVKFDANTMMTIKETMKTYENGLLTVLKGKPCRRTK